MANRRIAIGVVGAGRMGCAIAGWLAICGADVLMFDETEFTRQRAVHNLAGTLSQYVSRKMLLEKDAEVAKSRVKLVHTLEEVANVDMVVEAVPDDVHIKQDLFRKLDRLAPPHTILTTNSINFWVTDVANADSNHACCGVRFLFPVYFIDDVEVSAGAFNIMGTNKGDVKISAAARATSLLADLGLSPFTCQLSSHRRLLTSMEVERCESAQFSKIAALLQQDASVVKYYADGGHVNEKIQGTVLRSKKGECAICFEDDMDLCILLPCGHANVCLGCARSLKNGCWVCRVPVERIVPLVD